MSVSEPPAGLEVRFDLHGARFELRPRSARPLGVRLGLSALAVAALGLGLAGVGVAGGGLAMGMGLSWALQVAIPAGLVCAAVLTVALIDHAREVERLPVRIGEGWLVVGPPGRAGTARVDLGGVRRCTVEAGPDLCLHRDAGPAYVLPMRGHDLVSVGWVAEALSAASRDARSGDLPAPPALIALRARQD